jgi:hypothetical protein
VALHEADHNGVLKLIEVDFATEPYAVLLASDTERQAFGWLRQ